MRECRRLGKPEPKDPPLSNRPNQVTSLRLLSSAGLLGRRWAGLHGRQFLLGGDVGGGRLAQALAVHAALDHLHHGGALGVHVQNGGLRRLPEPVRAVSRGSARRDAVRGKGRGANRMRARLLENGTATFVWEKGVLI